MNDYTCLPASLNDSVFILELLSQRLPTYNLHKTKVNRFASKDDPPEYELTQPQDFDITSVFVVLNDGKRVGSFHCYFDAISSYRLSWLAAIEGIHGVGTFSIGKVKDIAIAKNCNIVKLSVAQDNLEAQKCYLRNGFIQTGFEGDQLKMELQL